ncbi:hypothetical protein BJV82DRAFT_18683 [Fennellomyces sp. T-0311]|nr:hypothetical protein BJV82DRAFT_18683 [Fennellomyces sp. T-0311]
MCWSILFLAFRSGVDTESVEVYLKNSVKSVSQVTSINPEINQYSSVWKSTWHWTYSSMPQVVYPRPQLQRRTIDFKQAYSPIKRNIWSSLYGC